MFCRDLCRIYFNLYSSVSKDPPLWQTAQLKVTGTEKAFKIQIQRYGNFPPDPPLSGKVLLISFSGFPSLASLSRRSLDLTHPLMLLLEATTFLASKSLETETSAGLNKSTQLQFRLIEAFFTLPTNTICEPAFARPLKYQATQPPSLQQQLFPGRWLAPSPVSQEDIFHRLFLLCSCSTQEWVIHQRFEFLWTNFTEFIWKMAHIRYLTSFLGAQGRRITPEGCKTTSHSTAPSSSTRNWEMARVALCPKAPSYRHGKLKHNLLFFTQQGC